MCGSGVDPKRRGQRSAACGHSDSARSTQGTAAAPPRAAWRGCAVLPWRTSSSVNSRGCYRWQQGAAPFLGSVRTPRVRWIHRCAITPLFGQVQAPVGRQDHIVPGVRPRRCTGRALATGPRTHRRSSVPSEPSIRRRRPEIKGSLSAALSRVMKQFVGKWRRTGQLGVRLLFRQTQSTGQMHTPVVLQGGAWSRRGIEGSCLACCALRDWLKASAASA